MCGSGSDWERCGGVGEGKATSQLAPAFRGKIFELRARALTRLSPSSPSPRQACNKFDMAVLARILALLILAVAVYAGEFAAT
jgi:hypothetical protein